VTFRAASPAWHERSPCDREELKPLIEETRAGGREFAWSRDEGMIAFQSL
jgi:hypothetical protein